MCLRLEEGTNGDGIILWASDILYKKTEVERIKTLI